MNPSWIKPFSDREVEKLMAKWREKLEHFVGENSSESEKWEGLKRGSDKSRWKPEEGRTKEARQAWRPAAAEKNTPWGDFSVLCELIEAFRDQSGENMRWLNDTLLRQETKSFRFATVSGIMRHNNMLIINLLRDTSRRKRQINHSFQFGVNLILIWFAHPFSKELDTA